MPILFTTLLSHFVSLFTSFCFGIISVGFKTIAFFLLLKDLNLISMPATNQTHAHSPLFSKMLKHLVVSQRSSHIALSNSDMSFAYLFTFLFVVRLTRGKFLFLYYLLSRLLFILLIIIFFFKESTLLLSNQILLFLIGSPPICHTSLNLFNPVMLILTCLCSPWHFSVFNTCLFYFLNLFPAPWFTNSLATWLFFTFMGMMHKYILSPSFVNDTVYIITMTLVITQQIFSSLLKTIQSWQNQVLLDVYPTLYAHCKAIVPTYLSSCSSHIFI